MELNEFSTSGRGLPKLHFCDIILKSGHLSGRRCHLKLFFLILALAAIIFSEAERF